MDDILKGNFKVKNPVKAESKEQSLKEELKKKVLASLGGSMVYTERTSQFTWDGDA